MNTVDKSNGDARLPHCQVGWAWTSIADVTQPVDKIDPSRKPDENFTYIDISSIDNQTFKIVEPKKYKGSNAPSRARQLVRTFDVLFSTVRTYLRNIAQVPEQYNSQIASTGFAVLRAEQGILPKYLFFFCLSDDFISKLDEIQRGTSYPAVRDTDIREQLIPLPPLAEQQRIVTAIEERLSQIDDGVTMLRRVQQRLKHYRGAVLKAASEGRLVLQDPTDEPASELLKRIQDERRAKWEADHLTKMQAQGRMILDDEWKAQYVAPTTPNTEGLPELPEGWMWVSLAQLAWDASYGTSQKSDYNGSGQPVVRIPNVSNGKLDLTDLKRVAVSIKLESADMLAPGDLLIIRTNGSKDLIGRSASIRTQLTEAHFFASYLIRYRLINKNIVLNWLSTIWNSPVIRQRIEQSASTTAGQYNINLSSLNTLSIPLPPEKEQQRIVAEAERRLSIIDNLAATIEVNLQRADRLRQIVFEQAFAGTLVPQNSDDESADILLQRIAEERAKREAELQAAREAEAKQPKPRGGAVGTKKSKERRSLYDVLVEAKTRLTPEELFQRAEYIAEDGLIAESVEVFYDELRKEIPARITVIRPNPSDVYLEAVQQ